MAFRKDNKPLSKEEQQEEEMRNELMEAGLLTGLQEDMDKEINKDIIKDYMKQLVKIIRESKNDTTLRNEENSPKPSSPLLKDSKPTQSTSNVLEDNAIGPPSNFSNEEAVAVQTISEQNINNKEKSPESALSKFHENNLNKESNSSENESFFSKIQSFKKDDFSTFEGKSNLRHKIDDGPRYNLRENKKLTAAQTRRNTLERWKLNPLRFEQSNDVPLKHPEHLHTQQESMIMSYDNEDLDLEEPEIFEVLCQQMTEKLKKLRQQYNIPHKPTRETKSQWGSPIKVALKWNDSLDKNPVFMEKTPTPCSSPDPVVPVRETRDRATKRKALCTIAAVTNAENSDENSDNEFVITKKRKCQQVEKAEEKVNRNQEGPSNKQSSSIVETIEVDDNKDISDMEMFDNSDLHSLRKNSVIKDSTKTEFVEEQSQYPRRIPPPNPNKKFFKGPRGKKKNVSQAQNSSLRKDLNDEEINKTINAIDVHICGSDGVDIVQEIKPLSVPKSSLQKKLQIACVRLENVRDSEEQKIKAEEEERKRKEKEEELKRDELISRRLQEEEDRNTRKLEKERKQNEQTEFYKSIINSKQRVMRSHFDKSKRTYEEQEEDMLLEGDDDEPVITHANVVTKSCPICSKSFPSDQIESHASECNAFSSEADEINNYQPSSSRSRESINECHICNKFKTRDGNMYGLHVMKCKEKAQDRNGYFS